MKKIKYISKKLLIKDKPKSNDTDNNKKKSNYSILIIWNPSDVVEL